MVIPDTRRDFESPKFRQLLVLLSILWLGLVLLIAIAQTLEVLKLDFSDPLLTPLVYLVLFGGSSCWILRRYRQRRIHVQLLVGVWPSEIRWRMVIGLWILLFMFSLGAFQVSFALLSYIFPETVQLALQDSIFLGKNDTAIPWLYNLLMFGILVIAAPILEEFLFRAFLLHRWATRWNLPTAVVLSSFLFGILHSNIIGLTVFGFAMALLYLRSRSLGLVIVIHSMNNAIAASLEIITRLTGTAHVPSLQEFRSSMVLGLLLLIVSTPLLIQFFQRNWSATQTELPYFANRDRLIKS
jgi:membrane protease YdiL (CAAX protease family)